MVSFDTNAQENQFLQGWLIQDRFMLRGELGSPYEFLWANPYQPGLSFFHLPLIFHDPQSGALFIRSSWDEDADWFGWFRGEAQLFRDGKVTVLSTKGGSSKPIAVGEAGVLAGRNPMQFTAENESVFVVGMTPNRSHLIEVDDEELAEERSDGGGTIELHFPQERSAEVRIREDDHGH